MVYVSKNSLTSWQILKSSQNMNTVDVIFPTWPLYLYTNPDLGKYLLNVLLEYQASGQYPNDYSIHDVGEYFSQFANQLF